MCESYKLLGIPVTELDAVCQEHPSTENAVLFNVQIYNKLRKSNFVTRLIFCHTCANSALKNIFENGIVRDQTSFNRWVKANIEKQGGWNSDSINAQLGRTDENNDRLDNETLSRESRRGDGSSSGNTYFGTGFIKVLGADGTNSARYIQVSNPSEESFKTPQGEVYGFVDKEGNIYLDETIISPEHPIHEYTHLWDRAVAKNNPELWNRGVALMQQTPLWQTLKGETLRHNRRRK